MDQDKAEVRAFREALEENSMSPKDFANAYGLTERAVQYWLSEDRPIPAWVKIVLKQRKNESEAAIRKTDSTGTPCLQGSSMRYVAEVDFRKNIEDDCAIRWETDSNSPEDKAMIAKVRMAIVAEKEKYANLPYKTQRRESSGDIVIDWIPAPTGDDRFVVIVYDLKK